MSNKPVDNTDLSVLLDFVNLEENALGDHAEGRISAVDSSLQQLRIGTLMDQAYKNASKAELLVYQARLRDDLASLVQATPDTVKERLRDLIWKIDNMGLKSTRHVVSPGELNKWQAPSSFVEIAGQQFAIVEYDLDASVEKVFYRVLNNELRGGMRLSRIKQCQYEQCRKFFLQKDLRSRHCSPECQPSSNKRRPPEYFAEKARQRRAVIEKAKKKEAADKRRQQHKAEQESLIEAFAQFLKIAANPRTSEQVGHITRLVGPGLTDGWKKVNRWLSRLKQEPPATIWNSLDIATKTKLKEPLRDLIKRR